MKYIRELKEKDATLMFECLNDKVNTQYMLIGGKNFSYEDCLKFINSSKNDDSLNFAIVDEEDNWIGTISLKHIDKEVGQAEYAIITSSRVHGKGYAYKASEELKEYAFSTLKLQRIYLNVASDNLRAINFYKRFGFTYEGTFRRAIKINNQLKDLEWYSIINNHL